MDFSPTTLTQVRECRAKILPTPKKRNPVWFVRKERTVSVYIHIFMYTYNFYVHTFNLDVFYCCYEHLPFQTHEDFITKENQNFITEVLNDRYGAPKLVRGVQTYPKSVNESLIEVKQVEKPEQWHHKYQRRCGVIARKIGVLPIWQKNGTKITTTLLQIDDNHVIKYLDPSEYSPTQKPRVKNLQKFGCVLVGAGSADPSLFTKEYCGLFKDSGVMPKRYIGRFLVTPAAKLLPGTPLTAAHFRVGDYVDVRGKT